MQLLIKKLSPNAIIPTRASQGSVGYDLYSTEDTVVPCQCGRVIVGTGIAVGLPEDVYARIAPRSGLAAKHCIDVGAGVIDPDYTGEIKVIMFNHGSVEYVIKQGDKIAQMILERCETPPIEEVIEIENTVRGTQGFGSSD